MRAPSNATLILFLLTVPVAVLIGGTAFEGWRNRNGPHAETMEIIAKSGFSSFSLRGADGRRYNLIEGEGSLELGREALRALAPAREVQADPIEAYTYRIFAVPGKSPIDILVLYGEGTDMLVSFSGRMLLLEDRREFEEVMNRITGQSPDQSDP